MDEATVRQLLQAQKAKREKDCIDEVNAVLQKYGCKMSAVHTFVNGVLADARIQIDSQ